MFFAHIRSIIYELAWRFQIRYLPFQNDLSIFLFLIIFVITSPYWLSKIVIEIFRGKSFIFQLMGFIVLLISVSIIFYLYLIIGQPNQKLWQETIFPRNINRIATKVRDNHNNMIGNIANPNLNNGEQLNGTLYIEKVPKIYWAFTKFREDRFLSFDNKETGFWGIFRNSRSFNGVDPIGIPMAILNGRGGSSLSQQLVKNFYGQDSFNKFSNSRVINTLYRKIKELKEAKTFYHNLRDNNGEKFKRWIAMYSPPFLSNGTVYGIDSASAIIFGKKLTELEPFEQILLSEMHRTPYAFNNPKQCQKIELNATQTIKNYAKTHQIQKDKLIRDIQNWECPKKPKVPAYYFHILQKLNTKESKNIGNPTIRAKKMALSSIHILEKELKQYRLKYPNRVLTQAQMSIDVPANHQFKQSINHTLSNIEKQLSHKLEVNLDTNNTQQLPNANIWISVVNSKGEIIYIYQWGNTAYKRRIGSISKIFEAIALANRGDRYNYYYCNEPYKGLHNSDGATGGKCSEDGKNIYSARRVFGASKNLPLMSAFSKYVIKDSTSIKIVHKAIKQDILAQLYHDFNLSHDSNQSSMQYELSFGMVNATPLTIQKAMNKLNYLLYKQNSYKSVHITKKISYKKVKNSSLVNGGVDTKIYNTKLPSTLISKFDSNTKEYLKTVLKAPINSPHGTLRSLKSIKNFTPLFLKTGTTDTKINGETLTQSKWIAGAIKVKGENYSLVIMVENQKGLGRHIKHYELTKPIFYEVVKALNRR